MKIHSDTLTRDDLHSALSATVPGADLEVVRKGSRRRANAYDFRLSAVAGAGRRRNSGTHGAENTYAASWDEHGRFFAALFELDGEAIIGPYDGREHFHSRTEGKYAGAVGR